jgi:hypothetical protein
LSTGSAISREISRSHRCRGGAAGGTGGGEAVSRLFSPPSDCAAPDGPTASQGPVHLSPVEDPVVAGSIPVALAL